METSNWRERERERARESERERLTATLRLLVTGDSFTSLQYLFRISKQIISIMIPEVCYASWESMKDYVRLAAVAERLACSPPTKANRVQPPAGLLPDLRSGNRTGRWRFLCCVLSTYRYTARLTTASNVEIADGAQHRTRAAQETIILQWGRCCFRRVVSRAGCIGTSMTHDTMMLTNPLLWSHKTTDEGKRLSKRWTRIKKLKTQMYFECDLAVCSPAGWLNRPPPPQPEPTERHKHRLTRRSARGD
ncbi:hypothetical protein PR048_031541 [Dryococelus australis]|uniref:Uncharacterized protein n=1 Tax=Dryococelus australis TaxID=614101 RepID=A0ABQ9G6A1_9NEOP|nr:hypothetical protein PR048_031541 [Dryococelus australis]